MKLLICPDCQDVFNLKRGRIKKCSCGRTQGIYIDDVFAIYCGGVPLGFKNSSLISAVKARPEFDNEDNTGGERFLAFVIPKLCNRMEVRSREELEAWNQKAPGT